MDYNGGKCSVKTCTSALNNGKRFFRFPSEPDICQLIVQNINRPDLINLSIGELRDKHFLCSDHFQQNEFHNLEEVQVDSTQSQTDLYRCVSCENIFTSEESLLNHCSIGCPSLLASIKVEYRESGILCKICNQRFTTKDKEEIHLKLGCPALFNALKVDTKSYLESEIKKEISPNTLRHSRKTKQKVIECSVCGKMFANPNGLKNHMKIHNGDRPYACSECGKTFTVMSCLKTHLNTIHSNKKYPCPHCGKDYQSEHYLKTHLKIHAGKKDFECGHCMKAFVDSQALKLHMRTHSGERPYICPYKPCSKSFTQQSHLKTHQRLHTGEKPYRCHICGKDFRQLSNIREHQRMHEKYSSQGKTPQLSVD